MGGPGRQGKGKAASLGWLKGGGKAMKQLWKGAVLAAAIVLGGCAAEPAETELEIAQAAGAPFFEGMGAYSMPITTSAAAPGPPSIRPWR